MYCNLVLLGLSKLLVYSSILLRVCNMTESKISSRMKNNRMKNITKKIAYFPLCIVLCLFSFSASAIVIDRFIVESYLGKPLNGSFVVKGKTGDDLSLLAVSLASYDEFNQAGINYTSALNNLNFTVENVTPTKSIVKVTSTGKMNDPFVHLLLKLSWNGGQLLREFTALIDPPVYSNDKAAQIESAISQSDESDSRVISSNEYTGNSNVVSTSAYGTVTARDSLSTTALQIQSDYPDLSIYQIMTALYRDNPDAFIDNNINGLIKGSVLTVDEVDNIQKLSRKEGVTFFFNQLELWKVSSFNSQNLDNSVKISQGEELGSVVENSNEDTSTDVSSVESQTEIATNSITNPEFQVAASNFEESTESKALNNEIGELKARLTDIEASYESAKLENKELKETIEILESQLLDSNKLIELSNQELASLQQSKSEEEAINVLEQVVAENLPTVEETAVTPEPVIAEAASNEEEVEKQEVPQLGEIAEEVKPIENELAEVEESVEEAVKEDVSVESAEIINNQEPTPVIETIEQTTAEKVESFVTEFWKFILGGLGILLLLGLLISRLRGKSSDNEESFEMSFTDYTEEGSTENVLTLNKKVEVSPSKPSVESGSYNTNASSIDMDALREATQSVTDFDKSEVGDDEATRESSFLTVYNDGDVIVNADEIDPIAEADVYIAYGRKDQGEEVLLEGVKSFPERSDIKIKLLELYASSEDSVKFSEIYKQLQDGGLEKNIDEWQKVQDLASSMQLPQGIDKAVEEIVIAKEDLSVEASTETNTVRPSIDSSNNEFDVEVTSIAKELSESHFNEITLELSEDDASVEEFDVEKIKPRVTAENSEVDDLDVISEVDFSDEALSDFNSVSVSLSEPKSVTDQIEISAEVSEIDFSDESEVANISDAMDVDLSSLDISSVIDFSSENKNLSSPVNGTEITIEIEDDNPNTSSEEVSIDFELDDLSESDKPVKATTADLSDVAENDLDDIDLNLGEDVVDLPDAINDPKTQLDLAKVFIELEDVNGAIKILKTLTTDSNVGTEAEDLLNKLS